MISSLPDILLLLGLPLGLALVLIGGSFPRFRLAIPLGALCAASSLIPVGIDMIRDGGGFLDYLVGTLSLAGGLLLAGTVVFLSASRLLRRSSRDPR